MFTRSMYRWASSEDVGLLEKNPVANFRVPKAPQNNHEITIISREEIPLILAALEPKGTLLLVVGWKQESQWHSVHLGLGIPAKSSGSIMQM